MTATDALHAEALSWVGRYDGLEGRGGLLVAYEAGARAAAARTAGRPFLTEQELADRWQVTKGSLANARSEGRSVVPFVKIMSRVRYPLAQVEQYEAGQVERVSD